MLKNGRDDGNDLNSWHRQDRLDSFSKVWSRYSDPIYLRTVTTPPVVLIA